MPDAFNCNILDEQLHSLVVRGSRKAYLFLKKRYHKHAVILGNEILNRYNYTGITHKEIVNICDNLLNTVIRKYISRASSFFLFWKERVLYDVQNYIYKNSYEGDAKEFEGDISFNEQINDQRYSYDDIIAEVDVDKKREKIINDIVLILDKYDTFFSEAERSVLTLCCAGMTIQDLERTGIYSRAHLYLTFNTGIEKVYKYYKMDHKK